MQRLKHLHAMWETWVQSLGQEDPLEKEMATHSSILAWRIPWTEELVGLQSMDHKESDTTERLHFHFHYVIYFGGLQNHCRWWLQPWNWKMLAPWKESYDQPRQHIKKHQILEERSLQQNPIFSVHLQKPTAIVPSICCLKSTPLLSLWKDTMYGTNFTP